MPLHYCSFFYISLPYSSYLYNKKILVNPIKQQKKIINEKYISDLNFLFAKSWKAIYIGNGTLSFYKFNYWKQWMTLFQLQTLSKTEISIEINNKEMSLKKWRTLKNTFVKRIIFKEYYKKIIKNWKHFIEQYKNAEAINKQIIIDFYDSDLKNLNLDLLETIINLKHLESVSFINFENFNENLKTNIKNLFQKKKWKQNRINGFIKKTHQSLYDNCFMGKESFFGYGYSATFKINNSLFYNDGTIENWITKNLNLSEEIIFLENIQHHFFYLQKWNFKDVKTLNKWQKLKKIFKSEKIFQNKYSLSKHSQYWVLIEKRLN